MNTKAIKLKTTCTQEHFN